MAKKALCFSPRLVLQTVVNDVPLDGSFIETQYGVILVIPQVLEVRRNRCSKQVSLQVNVRIEPLKNKKSDRNVSVPKECKHT